MAESVQVRCPACRREHSFTPTTFPCACGAPLSVPLLRGGVPVQVRHRSWEDSWVTLRCPACGRRDQWPRPEIGCSCGVTVRLPVDLSGSTQAPAPSRPKAVRAAPAPAPAPQPAPPPAPRPPFRPVTIRTASDVVTAAAQYLRWLGFADVRPSGYRGRSSIDVRGRGVAAQVAGDTRPATLKDLECLWLDALNTESSGVFFALAGYTRDARERADQLAIPLFVLDLTGTPQPVNPTAEQLVRTGAPPAP